MFAAKGDDPRSNEFEKTVESIFKVFDKNNDGFIELGEFEMAIRAFYESPESKVKATDAEIKDEALVCITIIADWLIDWLFH